MATPSDALIARIGLDQAALRNDLAQAKAQFEGFGGTVKGALGAVAGTLAATFSVAAFASWIKGAIDAADETNKLAQKVGLTVREVGGLQLAFRQAGLDSGQFEAAMGKLAKSASEGNTAFAAIGVNVRAADGTLKSTRQLLGETADQFAGMQDSAAKTALAMELFGKAGAALIPVLNLGAEGLRQFDAMAEQLGLTFDETTAKAAEQFNDTLDLIGQAGQGVARRLMAELVPTLNSVAGGMFDAVSKGDTLKRVAEALGVAFKGLYTAVAVSVTQFTAVSKAIAGVFAVVGAAARGEFSLIKTIIADTVEDVKGVYAAGAQNIRDVWSGANADTVAGLAAVTGAAKRAAPTLADVAKAAKEGGDAFAAQRDAAKLWADAFTDFVKLEREATAQTDGLGKAQKRLLDYLQSPGYANATEEMRQLALQQGYAAVAAEQNADAQKALQAVLDSVRKAAADQVRALEDSAAAVEQQVATLADEARAAELAGTRNIALAEAVQLVAIARLENHRAALMEEGTNAAAVAAVEREIEARRDLIRALSDKSGREAAAESARTAADSWRAAAADIERALTDALVRGFEGGKSVVKSIGEYIVNYFKTTIARGIAQAVTGSITGLLGGVAQAATGTGGGATDAASLLGSLGSLFGGTGSFFSGLTSLQTPAAAFNQFLLGGSGSQLLGAATPYLAAAYGAYRLISGAGTGRDRAPGYQQFGLVGDQGFGYAAGSPNLALGGAGYYTPIIQPIADAVATAVARLGGTVGRTTYGIYTSTGSENSGAYLRADVGNAAGMLFQTDANGSNADIQQRIAEVLPKLLLAGLQDSNLDQVFADYFGKIDLATATDETVNAAINAAVAAREFSTALGSLGDQFRPVAGIAVEAQLAFAGMLGGIGGAVEAVRAYRQEFYSEAEQLDALRDSVAGVFAGIGEAVPATRDAFRELVESQDLTTESGQRTFATLMGVAGAFAQLVPPSAAAVDAVAGLATAMRSAADIAAEREGLERQLLNLQGDTAELRERDLAALDESNRGLQQRIWALEDERAAAEAARESLDRMMASAGLSAGRISDLIRDGLLGRVSAEDLGGQLGDLIVGGIEQALASQFAGSVSSLFTDTIVTPMLQAVLTGGEIAQAVSQQSIDAAVRQAEQAATAFASVLSDPGFVAAMDRIRAAVSGIAGAVAQPGTAAAAANTTPAGWFTWTDANGQTYWSSTTAATGGSAAPDAAAAGDGQAAAQEAYRLTTQLLQVLGDTTQLRARELELLDPSNRALQQLIWAKQDEIAATEASARAAAEAAAAQQQAAAERQQAAQQLFAEGRGLEVEYLTAIGDREGALARARQFAIATMDDELVAYYDANAATRALIESVREAAAAENRRASEAQSLQQRLLQAQGDTAALRAAELAALDPANRALLQLIWSLEDAAVAADAAARAQADQAAEAARIADERQGIERQLLQLSGDTAAIRAAELAAVDESNRELLESVHARQDEIEAARAAEALASRNADLQRRILELEGNTAALREIELAAVDESTAVLLARIWALQDEAVAAREAQAAADELAAANRAVADERYALETRLLQLNGDTLALRERELAAVSAGNRELLRAIFAREDELETMRLADQARAEALRAAEAAQREALQAAERAQQDALRAAEQARDELLRSMQSLFDFLTGQVRELLDEAGAGMTAAEGRGFLAEAIALAELTGSLPDQEEIARAVAAARGGLNDAFASKVDADRARLTLAGMLSDLAELTNGQMSVLTGPPSAAAGVPVFAQAEQANAADAAARAATSSAESVAALRAELAGLRAEMAATAIATAQTQRLLDRVINGEDTVRTEVIT